MEADILVQRDGRDSAVREFCLPNPFFQFFKSLFLLESQKSAVLSKTQFLLWFYGKPPGAKCP